MAMENQSKWYSDRLTEEEARDLNKRYAKIEEPSFVLEGENLALQFRLIYENGSGTVWRLRYGEDIRELFVRTKAYETTQLEGKVVEAFCNSEGSLRGLSVNKNLV